MTTEELKEWARCDVNMDCYKQAELGAAVLALIAERDALTLSAGEYHVQRGAPSWKPQCQIDLEHERARATAAEAKLAEAEAARREALDRATGWAIAHDELLDRVEALEKAAGRERQLSEAWRQLAAAESREKALRKALEDALELLEDGYGGTGARVAAIRAALAAGKEGT